MAEKKGPKHDLSRIVADLDPDKIDKDIGMKHRTARNKYVLKNISVDSHGDFVKGIVEYMKHHRKEVGHGTVSEHELYATAKTWLDQVLREQGGYEGAYKMARKGKMGQVINTLAEVAEGQDVSHYQDHVFSKIDPLDHDAHKEIAQQYVSKFGTFMPKEIKQKSPDQLAADYKTLIGHVKQVTGDAIKKVKKYDPETPKKKK